MYVELTPEDTLRDLRNLLLNAIPNFEFPRNNLFDYSLEIDEIYEDELESNDFVVGVKEENDEILLLIERSCFNFTLTQEEINILAILMMVGWVQRQVTSIENTRMKYSGSDFKMTSQANHLQKMLALLTEVHRQSHHMQRLYKRRKLDKNNNYKSNWSIFRKDYPEEE